MYKCIPKGKYLNKIEKHFEKRSFIKFGALQSQLTQLRSQSSYI